QFQELTNAFENFVKIYEYCLIDNALIFKFYSTLVSQKIYIMTIINSFIFSKREIGYENIIIRQNYVKT
ncbi:MAG: hypothetical protein WCJ59_03290, partial [bacterium]